MTANVLLLRRRGWLCLASFLALFLAALLLPSSPARAALLSSPAASCDPTIATCAPGGGGSKPLCELLGTCPPGGGGGGGGGPTCPAPPGGGSPSCGGAGPASVGGGGTGGVSVGGGNPINLLSGNKYQEETDLAPLPGVLGLELRRHYNSLSSYAGLAGAQWATSYETVLYDLGHQVQIVQADGRRITLQRGVGANARLCTSPQPQDGQVRIEGEGAERVFHWRWGDGRTLSFRSVGPMPSKGYPLHSITAATGERVQLAYNPLGDLSSITDPQGRRLVLAYGKPQAGKRALLQSVSTPLGQIRYRHDELGRLTHVMHTAAGADKPHLTRLYHYEAAHQAGNVFALTGISVQAPGEHKGAPQRLSTYAYETSGRAILSTKGRPLEKGADGPALPGTGVEQITLNYLQTATANEGAPDKNGEVQPRPQSVGRVQLTNSLGQTSTLTTAVIGGQLRLIEFTGAGCSTCGPANRRYGYDTQGRLLRSIELDVKGQPLSAELHSYDRWGRLSQRSRQAYSQGKPVGAPQWLQRYEYTDLRFKDGSVAVGQQPTLIAQPSVIPGKTRSTEFDYNDKGQVLRITERGWSPIDEHGLETPTAIERSTRYAYTTIAGKSLLAEIDGPLPNGPNGTPEDSDVTRFSWDERGARLVEVQRPEGLRWTLRYEAAALRPSSLEERWGSQTYRRELAYDLNGEVRSLHTRALSAGGQVLAERTELRQFEALREVLRVIRGDGAQLEISREPRAEGIAATASEHRAVTANLGIPGSVTDGLVLALSTSDRQASRQLDDWGRLVSLQLPHEARRWARYDAANQLQAMHQGDGSVRTFVYNRAGQLQQIRDVQGNQATVRQFAWDGAFRITEDVLDEAGKLRNRLSLRFDAWGQLAKQDLFVAERGKTPVAGFQNLYDKHGHLTGRRFNDGQEFGIVTTSQVVEVRQQRISAGWRDKLSWIPAHWWPTRLVASHARRAPDASTGAERSLASASATPVPLGELRPLDARGRAREIRNEAGVLRLNWTVSGELASVQGEGGQRVVRYDYDARSRRLAKHGADGSEYFLYDGTQLVSVWKQRSPEAAPEPARHFAYAGFRVIAMLTQGKGLQVDTDSRGAAVSVHSLEHEQLRWTARLDDKGRLIDQKGPELDPGLRLVNQWHDAETGLHYNVARYYDPRTGRFLSTDPSGLHDSIDKQTPAALQLDTTVYAAAQPWRYFDPDGAAKLTYYLIDSSPDNKTTATMRWGFWLRDIAPGNSNQYLYDVGGSFLAADTNPLKSGVATEVATNYARWTAKDLTDEKLGNPIQAFVAHYLKDMQSPDAYTVEIAEGAALQIASNLSKTGDVLNKYYCDKGSPKLVYPAVTWRGLTLSPGGILGSHDDSAGSRVDQGTDTASCDQLQTPARAFARLKSAVIAQETGGKDCSSDGCPAGTKNPSGTPASYGSTQFVVATFVDRLLKFGATRKPSTNGNEFYKKLFDQDANLTEAEKKTLGYLDKDGKDTGLQKQLEDAVKRAESIRKLKGELEKSVSAATDPTTVSDADLEDFAKNTGFAHVAKSKTSEARTMYERMVRWQQMKLLVNPLRGANANATIKAIDDKSAEEKKTGLKPTTRERFDSLLNGLGMTEAGIKTYLGEKEIWNEGWEGFRTAAIFTDSTVKKFLLTDADSLFKSTAKFDIISDREMKWKYAEYSAIKGKNTSEEDLVKYIAYFHNSGGNANSLSKAEGLTYVKELVKKWEDTAKRPCAAVAAPRFKLDPASAPASGSASLSG
jgi:RHS repeat-associated protein